MRIITILVCWGVCAWGSSPSDSIRVLLDRSTELERGNNLAEAEIVLRAAVKQAESAGDTEDIGLALSRLAGLYTLQGRSDDARASLAQAIRTWMSNGDTPSRQLIRAAGDLIMIYKDSGDSASASRFWNRTLQPMLSRVNSDSIEYAELLEQHSMVCLIGNGYGKAELLLTGAIEILERKGAQQTEELAIALTNRSAIRIHMHHPDLALADSAKALALLEITGQAGDPGAGIVIGNMGIAYFEMRRFEEADVQFGRALRILEQWPASPQEADILKSYARLLQKSRRKDEAHQMELRANAVLAEFAARPRGERIDASEFGLSSKK